MPIKYDEQFVKRPQSEHDYTEEEILELKKCSESCVHFIKYVKIVNPDYGEVFFEPYDYQLDLLQKFQDYRFNVGLCSRQSGKALSLDTLIPLPNGKWSTMGDIKVGDFILDKKGNATKITYATEIMTKHNCYEIEFDTGEKITADEDHLWKVGSSNFCKRQGKDKPILRHLERVLTTKEILQKHNQFKNYKKPANLYIKYHEPIKGKKINLLVDPYTLGIWLGDGHSADGRISSNIEDSKEISKLIKKNYNTSNFKRDKRTKQGGYFNVYKLITNLKQIDVLNNKHIPSSYFSSPKYQRIQLLRGLMDSDGSCDKSGSCEFYQKSYDFILQVRELLSSLGIKSRIGKPKEINGELYNRISFTTKKFYVFNLQRKRNRQKRCLNHPKNNRIYIKNIRKVDSVPVRCIQVDNPDHLFLCGKTMIPTHNTTIVSAYVLWYAMFNKDKVIGIVSNKEKAAKMILDRIKRTYEQLPTWLKPGVTEYSKTFTSFENGTKIVISATSADAFRGETMNLLVCDEFAFVPGNQAEDFWSANYPTISASKNSKIIIISTPNGLFNIFHRIYLESTIGQNSFVSTKVSWERVPGRDKDWAEEQVKNLGKRQFSQEFAVEFIGSTNTLIEPNTLEVILNQSEDPIHTDLAGRLRLWEKPEKGAIYIIGCDPAKGTGENFSTAQIIKLLGVKPVQMKQVGVFHDNMTDVYDYSDILVRLAMYYNNGYLLCENNGEGSAVVNRIWWEHEYENLVNSGSKTANLGIRSTGGAKTGTKPKAVLLMKKLIEDGSLKIYDERTLKELGSFIEENGRFFGKDTHDDLVSAMFWACYFLEMGIMDENYEFKQNEKEDIWGILSDLDEIIEDWSWLTDSDGMTD